MNSHRNIQVVKQRPVLDAQEHVASGDGDAEPMSQGSTKEHIQTKVFFYIGKSKLRRWSFFLLNEIMQITIVRFVQGVPINMGIKRRLE